jgi:hypothetical protein
LLVNLPRKYAVGEYILLAISLFITGVCNGIYSITFMLALIDS